MAFIKDFLQTKAFRKANIEVDEFMRENEIEDTYMVQGLIFDKVVYPDQESVLLWAEENHFKVELIEESKTSFIVTSLDASEFVKDTLKTLEISNGVLAMVGLLKVFAIQSMDRSFLSLGNEDQTIKFNDSLPHIIELAKVIKGYHANYGEVELTRKILQSFAENFDNEVYGVDLMIDYDHNQAKAAGWIKSVFMSIDGDVLYGEVKWTPKGAQTLSDRDFRYFSPEFSLNYVHPHTGIQHGPTLLGGGLVNRPFLKMDAIVSFKEQNNNQGIKVENVSLSEHNAAVSGLEKTISDFKLSENTLKAVVEGQKTDITKLSEKIDLMEKVKREAELKAANELLFSENKINKAQLDALNEGKTIVEVLSLSTVLNTEAQGKTGSEAVITFSDSDKAAMAASGLNEEDYKKYVLEA